MAFKPVNRDGQSDNTNDDASSADAGNDTIVSGFATIDPASIGGSGSDGGNGGSGSDGDNLSPGQKRWETRRRNAAERGESIGGKRSSGNTKASPSSKVLAPDRFAPPIMVAHMLAASKLGPHWAMEEKEAVQLSTAITNYLQYTKIKMDPKTEALFGMMAAFAMVEGPRIMTTVMMNAQNAKPKKARQQNETVVPFPASGNEFPYTPPFSH